MKRHVTTCTFMFAFFSCCPMAMAMPLQMTASLNSVTNANADQNSASSGKAIRDQALKLLHSGQAEQSYQLLINNPQADNGDVGYDYIFGAAAASSGHPQQAIEPLVRVVSVNAGFQPAQLLLARAYFETGQFKQSRQHFKQLLQLEIDPQTRQIANHHLELMQQNAAPPSSSSPWSGFIAYEAGYDTNVSNLTGENSVYLPAFNFNYELDQDNQAARDQHFALSGGATLTLELDNNWQLQAEVDLSKLSYSEQDQFDNERVNTRLQAGHQLNPSHHAALSYQYNLTTRDNDLYNKQHTLAGKWRYQVTPSLQNNSFLRYSVLRYQPFELYREDMNLTMLGSGLTYTAEQTYFGNLYLGHENTTAPVARLDGDARFWGLISGVLWPVKNDLLLTGTFGYKQSHYQQINTLLDDRRKDRLLQLTLSANWLADPYLSFKPEIKLYKNLSNSELNQYKRAIGALHIRYDFR